MLKRFLLGVGAWALAASVALAQVPQTPSGPIPAYTGTELLRATSNNGSAAQIVLNQTRNTAGMTYIATGGTVNTAANWYQSYVVAVGAITTWNITLPNPAPDGMMFVAANGTGAAFTTNTSVTALTTPQNQVLSQTFTSQTINAGSSAQWVYRLSNLTWYRVR